MNTLFNQMFATKNRSVESTKRFTFYILLYRGNSYRICIARGVGGTPCYQYSVARFQVQGLFRHLFRRIEKYLNRRINLAHYGSYTP